MEQFLYTVWLQDHGLLPEDQDHEYPACLLIEAHDLNEAKEWGDFLASSQSGVGPQNHTVLRSDVQVPEDIPPTVPLVHYRTIPSWETLGW